MTGISVIIPTHNRANLLYRAIKSVQNQTQQVDEIIIVSDGSTDNTVEIVEEMQKSDNRIKLISYFPGRNGNYARNQGISIATRDYIAFLDDDDEWLPDKTEKQMQRFKENAEVGLVYGGQNCIFEDIEVEYQTKPFWKGDLSKRIFMHNDIGTPSQVIVKKEVLEKAGYFDLELGAMQDYDLWIRCCQQTKVDYIFEPCINYYNSVGTHQISANTEKYIKACQYINAKYRPIVQTMSESKQKEINAVGEIRIARRCLRNNDKRGTRRYAARSMHIHFSKHAAAIYIASFFSYKFILKIRKYLKY